MKKDKDLFCESYIYALGGVCYRALTGQVPEDATDRMRDNPLIPVSQRCAGQASTGFLSAIDAALSVDERDRPQSVGAWREVLGADTSSQQERRQEEGKIIGDETTGSPISTQSADQVKDAKRLNTWFKLHWIFLAAVIPPTALFLIIAAILESQQLKPDATFVLLGIIVAIVDVVFLVLTVVFGLRILHKLWSLIPTHKARTTPGKAVGFLFIPLFSLYWTFVATYGLAKALNAETGRKSVSEAVSFIYCCSWWIYLVDLLWAVTEGREHMDLAEFLWAIVVGREDQAWIVSIGFVVGFVLWFVMLKQMKNAGRLILQTAEA